MATESQTGTTRVRASLTWLDLALIVVLFCASVSVFARYTHGDLWLDEADYAVAGTHSTHDNRWDRSDKPDQPELLIRLRHYHAPATALILQLAHRFGSDDETLRFPFVLAGAASVIMIYLCGCALFGPRREIAFACALLTILTPANIRMASHAVPWSFIILELLILLYTTLQLTRTRNGLWLIAIGMGMGLLFVTSETFFVVCAVLAIVLPLTLLPEIVEQLRRRGIIKPAEAQREPAKLMSRGSLVKGTAGAVLAFLAVAVAFWPAGLKGHCITMLRHYIEMRHSESFAVNIGNQVYKIAPKWSYLYWYFFDYRPFFLCYAVGFIVLLLVAILQFRTVLEVPASQPDNVSSTKSEGIADWVRLPTGSYALLLFTLVLLAAAHRAHIIGPEYLAHCLPFLALCAGCVVQLISRRSISVGFVVLLVAGGVFLRWRPSRALPGMEPRTQISRWKPTATAIAARWQPLDRILLGPQSPNVAYWYLHEWAHIPMHDWQVGQFTLSGPGPNFLRNIANGKYRYIVVSSQFEDNVINAVDKRTMQLLQGSHWETFMRSDEHRMGPSRLTVFRYRDLP